MLLLAFWMALSLPPWLELHPGAEVQSSESPGLLENSYTVARKPAEAAEHFKPVFAKAKLPFSPNADGIGLSARVAAPECDLLLQFHPSSTGTTVRIHCAAKTAPAADFYIPPSGASLPSSGRTRSTSASLEDFRQRQRAEMAQYDRPVSAAAMRDSFYNNDAPPLAWPAWLELRGASQPLRPQNKTIDGAACLESRYVTAALEMTDLVYGYEDLLKANGFKVPRMKLSTGQTWGGGVVQNYSGSIEGYQTVGGKASGPSTRITLNFRRAVLNGPIAVNIHVCVRGSFGRR
jgi:hypothetical protein